MSAEPVRVSGEDPITSAPVLLLYGEEHTNLSLADELALDGYEVRRASGHATLRAACEADKITLVILGQVADRGAGLDVLRRLRAGEFAPEVDPRLRALWMSPNGELGDVLRGFEAGADDVIRSPFQYAEFRARVQALTMRRGLADAPDVIEYGELRIDTAAHEVTIGATPVVGLRRLEYALLVHLASNPTRVHTKDELLLTVWGIGAGIMTRTLDSHASRLRCKLARAGAEGWVRVTRGVGYRLAPDPLSCIPRPASHDRARHVTASCPAPTTP